MPDASATTPTPAAGAPPPPAPPGEGAPPTALTPPVETPPAAVNPPTALTPAPDAGTKDGAKGAGSETTPKDSATPGDKPAAGKPTEPVADDLDIKLPKGVEADLTKFKAEAKALGLKAEQAQKFVDLYAEGLGLADAKREAAVKAQRNEWIQAQQTDPEFGGAKLKENIQTASKAVARFMSPAGVELLAKSGLGDHPEFIRAFNRIGKAIAEDKSAVTAAGELPPKPSREEALTKLYDVHDQRPKK